MQQQEIIKCPNCGSNKVHREEELYVCDLCGTHYRDDGQYYELKDVIESQLLSQEETERGNLRQLLLREIEKDKFNPNYVIEYCEDLLRFDPDDIVANYFEKFCKRKNHSRQSEYVDFLKSLSDVDIDEYDEQLIVTFMVSHVDTDTKETIFELLQNRGILSEYNDLLDKSYKNYKNQYALYSNIKRKVFICHSSQNGEAVFDILIALEKEYGFNSCWISERNLPYDTTRYNVDIEAAIEKCEYFLVVTSEQSMYSKDVQKEMDYASKHEKPCIEYILDEESKGIARTEFFKQYFDGLQWVDGSQGPQYQEIIKKIEKLHIEEINKSKSSNEHKVEDEFKRQNDELLKQFEELKRQFNDNERKQPYMDRQSNLGFINIPSGVVEIRDGQYQGNKTIQIVQIPKSVKRIGKQAFKDCQNLEKVIFEDSSELEIIDEEAFCNCNYLINIDIPSKIKKIDNNAFLNCSSLKRVNYKGTISQWISIDFGNEDANALSMKKLYIDEKLFQEENIVLEEIDKVGSSAFFDCDFIKTITIPSSVTSIGDSAFKNCSSIKSIVIPSSVTSIGESAFFGCNSLESLTLPFIDTYLGYYFGATTYQDNSQYISTSLKTIEIVGGSSIPEGTFFGCSSLITISLPNSITYIGKSAFSNCSSLTDIAIPSSVTCINDHAFYYCLRLQSVTFKPNSNLENIENYAFSNCRSLINIMIPNSIKSIEKNAFADCELLQSVTFESNSKLKSIGDRAFFNCFNIETIAIPNNVINIGNSAFYNCMSLKNIFLPSNVTSIGTSAFSYGNRDCYCSPLNIYCEAPSQPEGWNNWKSNRQIHIYWSNEWHYANGVPTLN